MSRQSEYLERIIKKFYNNMFHGIAAMIEEGLINKETTVEEMLEEIEKRR